MRHLVGLVGLIALVACNGGDSVGVSPGGTTGTGTGTGTGTATGSGTSTGGTTGGTVCSEGIAALGCGTHDLANVEFELVASSDDGLNVPRDLEFHPLADELWVVNRADSSVVIITKPGKPQQSSSKRIDADSGPHFLAQPSALAFNQDDGTWASIHEEDDYTQGPPPWGTPVDFMGPSMWTGDSAIFDGGHGSHYDMLHNSPNGMGIAWDYDNVYWVVDGWHGSITRYNFMDDHGLGGSDHSDAIVHRFELGGYSRAADIPSHIWADPSTGWVYFAEAALSQISVLDPTVGVPAGAYGPNYDGTTQTEIEDSSLETHIAGSAIGLESPSGLEVADGVMYVTDNATGVVHAFDMDGNQLDYLDTGLGAGQLMGLAVKSDGSLWLVNAETNEIWKLSALE